MRFSRTLKSSNQSLPSPDGTFIATILPSSLSVKATRSLETIRVISLPLELATSASWFLWSKSSHRILIASQESIRVFSPTNSQFSAVVTNPSSGTTKITSVAFGADDDELIVFLDFGLKVSIFNLVTSKSVDISTPKFYSQATASRGLLYRPGTSNLTLLSRIGGKDVISIHARDTLDVIRSWWPDTIDAQGLSWSSDGRWLVVCESASQGHKIVVYTADGHLYRTWNGPLLVFEGDNDNFLGVGIKLFDWSKNGTHIAVGDYSNRVTLLSAPSFTESMSMLHTTAVTPADSLKIWQETIIPMPGKGSSREFTLTTQTICPPTSGVPESSNNADLKIGISIMSFDNSGSLLATRTEEMPTTMWIWDVEAHTLRAVLILHAPIVKATWHPQIDELLLVRCEGSESRGLAHLWDPSWEAPKVVDFVSHIPGGKVLGKSIARWLGVHSTHPALFFSDSQDCILASISGSDDSPVPWHDADAMSFDIYRLREESPLNLVPADEKRPFRKVRPHEMIDENMTRMSGGSEEMDDTFRFKKFVEPN